MKSLFQNNEILEIAENLVRKLGNVTTMEKVDIDRIATELFGMNVIYEKIAEDDRDKIACTSNGIDPLVVFRDGRRQQIVFPCKTIILDEYLQRPGQDNYRRYVLGHELGHVILGRIDPRHNAMCFNRVLDGEREYSLDELRERMNIGESQANFVSCALLLPEFILLNALNKYNEGKKIIVYGDTVVTPTTRICLERMADMLGVTYKMLFIELRKHKLIEERELSEYISVQVLNEGGDVSDR